MPSATGSKTGTSVKLSRRERQRLENPVRAAAMHKTRLENPAIELAFDPEPGFYVGCSGWYYRHWEDCFYPRSLHGKHWFEHYADNFGTVELNAPFYSWPTVATIKTWLRQAKGRPFVYTVKVNE